MDSSPGISLGLLLKHAKSEILHQFIDASTLQLVERLDPRLTEKDHLNNTIVGLLDSFELLSDSRNRELLIDLLPLSKLRELATRLGVEQGKDPYGAVRQTASLDSSVSVLHSFFGVVRPKGLSRDMIPKPKNVKPSYALFAHQRSAVQRVNALLSNPPHKAVLHMPTGSGKTRTAMHLVADLLNEKENTVVCWLAYSEELLEQAASEFESAWQALGNRPLTIYRYWGNRTLEVEQIRDGIIVSGLSKMDGLSRRDPACFLRLADRTRLTIIDEAHQAIAPTYHGVLTSLYTKRPMNALLGLTATPGRTWADIEEDQKLSDFFDGNKVALEVEGFNNPVDYLIEEGYLAKPIFRTLNSEADWELSKDDISLLAGDGEFPNQLLQRLGADVQRNFEIIRAAEELAERHRRTIVFAPSVQSAQRIAAVLRLRDVHSEVITGTSNPYLRMQAIRRYRSEGSRPMVLLNYGVLTAGFDAPSTSAAIIARPTKSLVLYSQMVGRATRGPRANGNVCAEVVTVADPQLPGFGDIAEAFNNWEDVWQNAE